MSHLNQNATSAAEIEAVSFRPAADHCTHSATTVAERFKTAPAISPGHCLQNKTLLWGWCTKTLGQPLETGHVGDNVESRKNKYTHRTDQSAIECPQFTAWLFLLWDSCNQVTAAPSKFAAPLFCLSVESTFLFPLDIGLLEQACKNKNSRCYELVITLALTCTCLFYWKLMSSSAQTSWSVKCFSPNPRVLI